MNKINLCYISTMTRWAGVETMLVEYLANRHDNRLKYYVIATSIVPEIASAINSLGVPLFIPKRRFQYDPSAFWQMAQWMRKNNIDIVHTFNLVSNCWGGIAARMARVPLRIAGEHGTAWLPSNALTLLEKRLYHTADLIVANSYASKTMLTMDRKIKANKIRIVHNAVDRGNGCEKNSLRPLQIEFSITSTEKVVGTVGRLSASKDYFTWLRAAEILIKTNNNVRFMIIGDGPFANALKQYVQELGIKQRVTFTGWRRDARRLIGLFDVYMCSSIHESFGNTLVEAAYCKKPVVAPNIDGIPEVVIDNKTGFLIIPDVDVPKQLRRKHADLVPKIVIGGITQSVKSVSPTKLAQKVDFLLNNPDICKQFGEAAYDRAIQLFSTKRYVKDLEAIYTSLYTDWKLDASLKHR